MRRFVFAGLTLAMLFGVVYVLKPAVPSQAAPLHAGYPVVNIGDVFRHY
ncbi:amino acid permease [Pseudomonas citronellolis]|nr:amino acid permease [Pseudomonas citronellolis]MCP1603591.1 hypothetical protein [Pseudomonas citronellolis]MCP1653342.1 hypothetical protein [Pseudomonas citronellolis]MCP1720338.1 hypothetical protein [Pseudomonas citronellolis]